MKFSGSMCVNENMLFSEVAFNFFKNFPMVHENETTFFYNLNLIKSDSTKNLKELGIKNMSTINVKTKTPINYPFNYNYGSMGMNPYSYMGLQNYMNMNIDNQILSQLNIHNNSEISVLKENEEYLNVIFNLEGRQIVVKTTKDTKFSELSKRFCIKAGY